MFNRKATVEQNSEDERANARERTDITLNKLQALKYKISEIRDQCEDLKKQLSANQVSGNQLLGSQVQEKQIPKSQVSGVEFSLCNECGKTIEPNQEVVVKDSAGMERRHYHIKCFQTLLR